MPSLQIVVLIVYFTGLFGVGLYATRFIGSNTDFLLVGRQLGPVLATATLCVTYFGGGFVSGRRVGRLLGQSACFSEPKKIVFRPRSARGAAQRRSCPLGLMTGNQGDSGLD